MFRACNKVSRACWRKHTVPAVAGALGLQLLLLINMHIIHGW